MTTIGPEVVSQQWKVYIDDLDKNLAFYTKQVGLGGQWLEEYKQHIQQLKEYSKKLEAPITAKICEVGYFCDAHVVKTNQVVLAITEELFVECSLFTAEKVLAQRLENMEKNINNGKEMIRILEEKKKYAEEYMKSGIEEEIVEVYDEEQERQFYERRKERSKKNLKEIEEKEEKDDDEHEKMMERLEELEKLELDEKEVEEEEKQAPEPFELPLEEYDEDDVVSIKERLLAQPGVSRKEMEALLEYLDDCDELSSEEEKEKVVELDSDDYEDDEPLDPSKKPGVRFSKVLEKVKTFRESDVIEVHNEEETRIETKSILRSKEPTPIDETALEEPEPKELAAMSSVTFPGEIVEKNPYECQPSTSKDPAPVITEAKVSRFRASRNKN